jgi:iron complex transport system substrate-binding protein
MISLILLGAAHGLKGRALGQNVMVDQLGREVAVPSPPLRIVSLAPSITECLFALGLGEEVVGVTLYSNFPPQVKDLPKVGTYTHLNLERVLALRPNLVVAIRDGNPREQVLRLAEMGLSVFIVDPRDLEGLYDAIFSLGRLVGRDREAGEVIRSLKDRVERVKHAVKGRQRPRVLLQVGIEPLVAAGGGTLQDQLITIAGGINVASAAPGPYPTLSMEMVLEARPEVIMISSMANPQDAAEELKKWRRWPSVPAVARGRVHLIDGDLIDRPSPRIVEGLEWMAGLIHPEVRSLLSSWQER